MSLHTIRQFPFRLAATLVLVAMTMAGPAKAQAPTSVTLTGNNQKQERTIAIIGPIKWVPSENAWLVSLRTIQTIQEINNLLSPSDKLSNNPNSYYYWARFARSYVNNRSSCEQEQPAAYISGTERVTGRWERKVYASPDARHCVTLWLRGPANYFHPDGFAGNGNRKTVFGSVWFRTPPRPTPSPQRSPTYTTTGCFNHYPDRNAIRQCLRARYGID